MGRPADQGCSDQGRSDELVGDVVVYTIKRLAISVDHASTSASSCGNVVARIYARSVDAGCISARSRSVGVASITA